MATLVWTNCYLSINSVVESDHVRSLTLNYEAELLDDTAMGDDTRSRKPGLLNWSVEAELFSDLADGDTDELLFALVGAAAFPIIVKPNGAATSTTNPSFTGNAVLENWGPVSGAVGDMGVTRARFLSAGTLTRAEA